MACSYLGVVTGYGVTWRDRCRTGEGHWERVERGAFAAVLRSRRDVRMTLTHFKPETTIGTVYDRCLRLWEDDAGLAFLLAVPDTPNGRAARWMFQDGPVGASIEY